MKNDNVNDFGYARKAILRLGLISITSSSSSSQ